MLRPQSWESSGLCSTALRLLSYESSGLCSTELRLQSREPPGVCSSVLRQSWESSGVCSLGLLSQAFDVTPASWFHELGGSNLSLHACTINWVISYVLKHYLICISSYCNLITAFLPSSFPFKSSHIPSSPSSSNS